MEQFCRMDALYLIVNRGRNVFEVQSKKKGCSALGFQVDNLITARALVSENGEIAVVV